MPEPDRQVASESLSQAISPLDILKQASSKVPALKYALGVAGIAAAIAIIKTLITDLRAEGWTHFVSERVATSYSPVEDLFCDKQKISCYSFD